MRNLLFLLFLTAACNLYAQPKTLGSILMVKPKIGQSIGFEDSWKAHIAKFHQKDTTNKRFVYEVLSGDRSGSYYLVQPGINWAMLDVERATEKSHDLDYTSTVSNRLEVEGGDDYYRYVDSMSYRPEVRAAKYLFTFYKLKMGKTNDLIAELMRNAAINKQNSSPASYTVYVKQMAGSCPTVLLVSQLKDGFKQLETDYFAGSTKKFQDSYVTTYGQGQWDKRLTLLSEIANSVESELVKFRQDMSSK
jgi:hypothetical protein